jgi:hypothetical protein
MTRLVQKRSRKTGLPPGTAVHIGEKKSERTRIQLLHYDAAQVTERELEGVDEGVSLRPGVGVTSTWPSPPSSGLKYPSWFRRRMLSLSAWVSKTPSS